MRNVNDNEEKVVEVSVEEELKESKFNKFKRGAKGALKDKDQQKLIGTIALVGAAANTLVTYAVTRDGEEAIKYGAKVGALSYLSGRGSYVLLNGLFSASIDGYVEQFEEE